MNTFRFAIMGPGGIAEKFVNSVAMTEGAQVVAVASKSMERAKAFCEKFGIPGAYDSYEEMLVKERPDCVYISTVPSSHTELTQLCIRHGVPVLCEKAMFPTGAEAQETLALARENNVFVMEAMWSRFLPVNRQVLAWLKEGRIGELQHVVSRIGFRAADDPKCRFRNKELAGGATTDILVYAYELADMMLPQVPGGPEILKVTAGMTDTGVDGWEQVEISAGGVTAELEASIEERLEDGLELMGTAGRIYVPHHHWANEATLYDAEGNVADQCRDAAQERGFVYEIEESMRCVREGLVESPTVPHDLTIRCAELFDRVYESMK